MCWYYRIHVLLRIPIWLSLPWLRLESNTHIWSRPRNLRYVGGRIMVRYGHLRKYLRRQRIRLYTICNIRVMQTIMLERSCLYRFWPYCFRLGRKSRRWMLHLLQTSILIKHVRNVRLPQKENILRQRRGTSIRPKTTTIHNLSRIRSRSSTSRRWRHLLLHPNINCCWNNYHYS